MIAVHVGTKGNPAVAHFAEPIEFAVKGQVLQDAEDGHEKPKRHDEPHEEAPVVRGTKRLGSEEKKESQGGQEQKIDACVVGRSGATKEKLPQGKKDESEQGRQKRRDKHAIFTGQVGTGSPKKKEEAR